MTNQQPEKRLAQHRRHLARTAHLPVNVWIAESGPANVRMTILERVEEGTDVGSRERHWIAEFQRQGIDLLNRTMGGQRGAVGYKVSDAERARRSAWMKGNSIATGPKSPEHREATRRALVGRRCPEGCTCGRHTVNPERGARISAAKRRQVQDIAGS